MEETFDRLFLVADELNVVDEENIELAVAPVEGLDLGVVGLVQADRVDELVREFLGVDVADLRWGIIDRALWPMACSRCVFPSPESP